MEQNLAYQLETREELLNGEFVAMSPRPSTNHSRVAGNIFWIFRSFLNKKNCVPFADGVDLHLTENDTVIPDMMIVCDREKIRGDGVYGAPDLVVEVLSPGTAGRDRGYKKDLYARCGVREYWIVSPDAKSVEVYRTDGKDLVLHDVYSVYPDWMLGRMKEEERAAVAASFRCSLYEDLEIALEDVFSGLLP